MSPGVKLSVDLHGGTAVSSPPLESILSSAGHARPPGHTTAPSTHAVLQAELCCEPR